MKKILLLLILCCLSLNSFAFTEEEATKAINAYNSFKSQLSQITIDTAQKRSTTSVILEGWIASGNKGLIFVSQDILPGPISKDVISSLAIPVYVEETFGLYAYQGYVAQVWYVNQYASLITLTTYTEFTQ